jgi:hypothetical protein
VTEPTREYSREKGAAAGRRHTGDILVLDQVLEFGVAVAVDPLQPFWRRLACANFAIGFADGWVGEA